MKRSFFAACLITLAFVSCTSNDDKKEETATTATDTSTAINTDTGSSAATVTMPDSATMMKNWMDYATPGPMHSLMSGWNGTWDAEVTMFNPGMPPQKSKATSVNTTIMGGRYHRSVLKGTMMGAPFNGESTMAYDNARKKFLSTWIDNMGTGLMMMEGTYDSTNKKLSMAGQSVDPSMGTGKMMDMREVITIIDDKTQMFEMYGLGPDGKEYKMMEIKYSKR